MHHFASARTSRPPAVCISGLPCVRAVRIRPQKAADQAGARVFLAGHISGRVTGRPAGRHGLPGSDRDLPRTVLRCPAGPGAAIAGQWPGAAVPAPTFSGRLPG